MLSIPLQQVPNQSLTVNLSGQNCQINVYQKFFGVFLDLYVDDDLIIGGCICQNLNRIVRSEYLGFEGDLGFFDTQGDDDPQYTGLGERYQLIYLDADDLITIGVPTLGS